MEKAFENPVNLTSQSPAFSLQRKLAWGLISGLAGTITMDLILMGIFLVFRLPVLTCFLIIGNTVAHFFGTHPIEIENAIQIGVATHYFVGPLIGLMFGSTVMRLKPLWVNSLEKCILAAILFVELLSQSLLVMPPILLKMTAIVILMWYGGSFIMHLIAAVVMGWVFYQGVHFQKDRKVKLSIRFNGEK